MCSAIAVENSGNRKIGKVSATYVSQVTCPSGCPLKGHGCYAEYGVMAYIKNRLNSSDEVKPIMVARAEARAIRALTAKNYLRIHVLGDCADSESVRIIAKACEEYTNKHGKIVWGYTQNRRTSRDNWGSISIFRSCTTLRQAETAINANFGAALIVPEFKDNKKYSIGRGLFGIPCPSQTGLAKTCVNCKLCMNESHLKKNKCVILFMPHGVGKNIVTKTITEK